MTARQIIDQSLDDCHAINAANERLAQRAEAAVWLLLALCIGCPLAWWLVEWAACGSNRVACA